MVRSFYGLVILSLFLPGISRSQEREPVQQIKSLMESCQFSQAVGLAELFLSRDSTRADLMLLKARSLAAMYQYREAVAALGKAVLTDSTDITVLNELVNVYRLSGDPEKAISVSRKINELSPGNRYFALQLANLYYSAEDYPGALQVFGALYRNDSTSYYIARQLGNCYNELRRSDSAIRFYRRALRISPYDQYATGKLVNVLIRENDISMALYWTQLYLQNQDSACIPILKQSGYCYYLLIDFKAAARQLSLCAGLGDSSKFTMKYLGLAWYKQEKYDTAAPFFRSAFYSDTTDAEVCFYYGVSAYRSLAVDTGLAYLNRTLRLLMPSGQFQSTLYSELADANTSKGNAELPVIYLKKALETNPSKNTLRFKLAYQYDFHLRKPYEALPWYREFLRNMEAGNEPEIDLPQQMSYGDYAKNRVKEIQGKK